MLTPFQVSLLTALAPVAVQQPCALEVTPDRLGEVLTDLVANVGPTALLRDPEATPSESVVLVDYYFMSQAARARILVRLLDGADFNNKLVVVPYHRRDPEVPEGERGYTTRHAQTWTLPLPILNKLVNVPEA